MSATTSEPHHLHPREEEHQRRNRNTATIPTTCSVQLELSWTPMIDARCINVAKNASLMGTGGNGE